MPNGDSLKLFFFENVRSVEIGLVFLNAKLIRAVFIIKIIDFGIKIIKKIINHEVKLNFPSLPLGTFIFAKKFLRFCIFFVEKSQ